jgi:hypothetical protein
LVSDCFEVSICWCLLLLGDACKDYL